MKQTAKVLLDGLKELFGAVFIALWEVRKLLLLWVTLILSILFMAFPDDQQVGFLYSDQVLTLRTWIYFLTEHLILVVLAWVIMLYERKFTISAGYFLFLQVIDTIDYCLTYADPWFFSEITFNTIKCVSFGACIAVDFIKIYVGSDKAN